MSLSVAIISFNGEGKIEKVMESIHEWVDEIVVVDSGSTDNTVDILKKYSNARVFYEEWKGEGIQYQRVVEKCKNEWILLLDQDEVVTVELKNEIENLLKEGPKYNIYNIRLINNVFGEFLKYDKKFIKNILFKKEIAHFGDARIHAYCKTKEKHGKLKGTIEHYTYLNIEEYFRKFNIYTTEGALGRFQKGKKANIFNLVLSPFFKFVNRYIFKFGFLDGKVGFAFSLLSAFYSFVIYLKLWELQKNKHK